MDDDSDDAMESQNEDDQPLQDGSKDRNEGELSHPIRLSWAVNSVHFYSLVSTT
jgi:hypothetical protein